MLELLKRGYKNLISGGSTEQQAIRSGIWAAGLNIGDRILQLLKIIILARLLSPEAFGLFGIALLVLAGLRSLSNIGFDEALVQHPDENIDAYLNTAWVIKIIRGSTVATISILFAPHIADLLGEPNAAPLIQVIGVSSLFLSIQNPATIYFRKDLDFHKEFVYQVGGRLIDFSIAIIFTLVIGNAWALVIGIASMNFSKFIISYVIHGYRPDIEFDRQFAREMFGFGKWTFATSILLFLFLQGDDGFVAWFFGATTLGYYQMAYQYSNAPATEITQVINRVAYPAFSKVQNSIAQLREGFFRIIQLSTSVSFPMAAGIIAVTPQFVYSILGDQWTPMIPLMQGLAVWGAFRSITTYGSIFKAVGRPELDTGLSAVRVLIMVIFIYPASVAFGPLGIIYVIVGQNLITQPLGIYMSLSITKGSLSRLFHLILYPFICSVGMAISVIAIDNLLFKGTGLIELVALVLLGILIYIPLMLVSETFTNYEITNIYIDIYECTVAF
jgi:O-antigen/teichoic acid export membrane protein